MNASKLNELFVSPVNQSNLSKHPKGLVDSEGNIFPFKNGLPDFTYPKELPLSDQVSLDWYKNNSATYDEYLPLTFQTFDVDENEERKKLVSELQIEPGDTILEIGCGTGRDSENIIKQMDHNGRLYLQDISPEIILIADKKLKSLEFEPSVSLSIANGYYLPFSENFFDKVFHFGGLNTFGDIRRSFQEIVRVTKPGGRVVVGDESMPPWLRDTEFGKILINSNKHYEFDLPLKHLPIEARNVKIEWIIGGVFYVISFDIGEGAPSADFDFIIPGARGGTHRTRYYGNLEGLSEEAVALAKEAREKTKLSMHEWLNKAIKEYAERSLNGKI